MDKIEAILGPSPFLVTIVDFKLYVWRDPGRLDRGNVGANDFGIRELVGKITTMKRKSWLAQI